MFICSRSTSKPVNMPPVYTAHIYVVYIRHICVLWRLLSATSSIFHPNMQHPKFYTFSISSSRFHLYLLILSISFLRFHPYFFILDILTFTYNPPSFQALKLHPEQFHNGILRLVISFLLFHPYHFISPNISLLFHTIYFHLLYFIL